MKVTLPLLLFTLMPASKKPGWVDWMKSPAQAVIMEDLRPGGPLYQRDSILAEDIFASYKQLSAFKNVVIDQFKACLKDHRLMAAKDLHRALQEEQYLAQDRQLYPRQPYNERGEPKFDMHPAKRLFKREDIKNKVHLTTHKAPRQLQHLRPEYLLFKPKKLDERICQEIKLQKCFHYLELKRCNGNGKKMQAQN
jgi:hypothetical protein